MGGSDVQCPRDGELSIGCILVSRMDFNRCAQTAKLRQGCGLDRIEITDDQVGSVTEGERGRRTAVGSHYVRLFESSQPGAQPRGRFSRRRGEYDGRGSRG